MRIAVIGTGFIGGILGRALASSGHEVVFGSLSGTSEVVEGTAARVAKIDQALTGAEVVILAVPGSAVAEVGSVHSEGLAGKLVIDPTNNLANPVVNGRASLPTSVRYARAFNTVGGENMADPAFDGQVADMFFSAPESDRSTVEEVIEGVGLHPVYVGEDQELLLDALFQLWIALAITQGRGRRLAFKVLED
jgi:8-hydroxy-5-deazaflavin:NADPH oxidoreductase